MYYEALTFGLKLTVIKPKNKRPLSQSVKSVNSWNTPYVVPHSFNHHGYTSFYCVPNIVVSFSFDMILKQDFQETRILFLVKDSIIKM